MVNLVRDFIISETYVDKNDPWTEILLSSDFAIHSTTNSLKCYSPGQLVFGRDMIIPKKYKMDWESICQKN